MDTRTSLNNSDYVPVEGTFDIQIKDKQSRISKSPANQFGMDATRRRTEQPSDRTAALRYLLSSLSSHIDILQPLSRLNTELKQAASSSSPKSISEATIRRLRSQPGPKKIQSTLVISKSKGPSETLRGIRTSTYQICRIEENTNRTTKM